MIFSPLLRDCRSPLQTEASCLLYKCNHFLRSERSFPSNALISVLSSQKHLYFIPIRTFLQPFRSRNCYNFISLDLHDPPRLLSLRNFHSRKLMPEKRSFLPDENSILQRFHNFFTSNTIFRHIFPVSCKA